MKVSEELYLKVAALVGGDDAIGVVSALLDLKKASDEEIANRTGLRLPNVRKVLYKLLDSSLVAFEERRERMEQTVFYWYPLPEQVYGFIQTEERNLIKRLKAKLNYLRSHEFYHCGTPTCRRLTFEEAVETLFKCPTCGKPLNRVDVTDIIEAIEGRIETIQRELKESFGVPIKTLKSRRK